MNPTLRKSLPLLTILCLAISLAFSQKTELRLNAYGGPSYFTGSAARSSAVGINDDYGVYGRNAGFAYSFELQGQWVTRQKHLLGVGIAFEKLTSKSNTKLPPTDYIGGALPPAEEGVTAYTNSFINLNPYIGQRLISNKFTLDAAIGVDAAFNVYSNSTFTGEDKRALFDSKTLNSPFVDVRPRLQLNAGYKHVSLLAGYSLGLTNYTSSSNKKAYLHFLQFGVGYKFK